MANRVLLGKRGTKQGIFVSRSGVDVTDSTSTTPLSFDSNAASSLIVHAYGECLLPALNDTTSQNFTRTWNGVTYNSFTKTITHNLGYIPAYAVRWNTLDQVTGGGVSSSAGTGTVDTTYTPFWVNHQQEECVEESEDGCEESDTTADADGGLYTEISTTTLFLENAFRDYMGESNLVANDTSVIVAAYIIFKEENFLNGESF
tara:strand:+ start:203 stop:811 length:609 start_codon:yes stop_codon:yes gene_type:complete